MTARTPQPVRVPKLAIQAKKHINQTSPTYVKMHPSSEAHENNSFKLTSDDLPLLVTRIDRDLQFAGRGRGGEEIEFEHGHWEIELAVPIEGRHNWFVWPDHVEEVDLPEFFIQGTTDAPTIIKHKLNDNLSPEDRFNFTRFDQPLQAKRIIPASNPKYIEFELVKPVKGKYNWFAFLEHVVPSKVGARVNAL